MVAVAAAATATVFSNRQHGIHFPPIMTFAYSASRRESSLSLMVAVAVAVAAVAAVALLLLSLLLRCCAVAAVAVATVASATNCCYWYCCFFFKNLNRRHVRVGMCERGIHFGLKNPSKAS